MIEINDLFYSHGWSFNIDFLLKRDNNNNNRPYMYSKRLFIWCVNMGVKRCCVISCDNDNRYPAAKIMEDVIKPEFLPQSCYVCYVMLSV